MTSGDYLSLFDELMRLRPEGLSPNAWAIRAGVSRTVWSDIRRHDNPSRRTLEKLLAAAGSSLAEFEALRIGRRSPEGDGSTGLGEYHAAPWRGAPVRPIPVVAASAAGSWDEAGQIERVRIDPGAIVGGVDRPAALAADVDAYAVTAIGDSMYPRFRPGRRLLVSPVAPVAIGDDVLVTLAGGEGMVLIKELAARSAMRLSLRQFQPDLCFDLAAAEVASVHKVMGEAI